MSDPAKTDGQLAAAAEDPILDEITRRLVETYRPERIYLFGSRARGTAGADSDYDLLVVVRHASLCREVVGLYWEGPGGSRKQTIDAAKAKDKWGVGGADESGRKLGIQCGLAE